MAALLVSPLFLTQSFGYHSKVLFEYSHFNPVLLNISIKTKKIASSIKVTVLWTEVSKSHFFQLYDVMFYVYVTQFFKCWCYVFKG